MNAIFFEVIILVVMTISTQTQTLNIVRNLNYNEH